jgi:hypothetical protein
MLIADSKAALERTVLATGPNNPLIAIFSLWLRPTSEQTMAASATEKAANAKGGERTSRGVAILGFACELPHLRSAVQLAFLEQLRWLTGRPNFGGGGEPAGVLLDPVSFLGVCVGAYRLLSQKERKKFDDWGSAAVKDAIGLASESDWQRDLFEILDARLNGRKKSSQATPPWLRAALADRGWAEISDLEVVPALRAAVQDAASATGGFEAALKLRAIDWATSRALDFDLAAMTVADVAKTLNNLPTIFQRWTWEGKPRTSRPGASPTKWRIENEYHVQSLVYTVLKPIFPALDEEKYLASTGVYQPRADLSLEALGLVIEAKFWYVGTKTKDLIEEIAADLSLYLRSDSPYDSLIAVIWDDAGRTQEHGELKRGLGGLNGMRDVVIVPKPSFMRD